MPDFEKIIQAIETIVNWIFRGQAPTWVFATFGYILLLALALLAIWGLLLVLSKIIKLIVEEFWPLFYNKEGKRRSLRRQRFADHIESEIRRLNNLEVWSDYRFAELEAEVEAEGRRRVFSILPFHSRTRSGLRRERSLSKALELSQERLILLEGEPGSGKSVALRHVAKSMARRAMRSRSTKSIIPIYINLKELERPSEQPIDRKLIYAFVLKSLNRVNDRDIEEFLEEEFDEGLREGTWLFLFDSFDELPEVLSSTEADTMIISYADAISDFLSGMNQCRGIIASRQFRGPGQLGWPRFRILPLSEKRRAELVCKADLKPELENTLIGQMGMAASHEIRSMANNPMFLGLLCEHIRAGNPFPENTHSVFETYIETRLTRDEERLWRRFELHPSEVRRAAEGLAFCMAADPGLGLSPTRQDLKNSTLRLRLAVGNRFNTLLDALEYIKLARSEKATAPGESKPFTFAHRRFQEYFATCVVLREPNRVGPEELLTDARWRETAVVMFQTQPLRVLSPILDEARRLLSDMVESTPGLIEKPLEYVAEAELTDQSKEAEQKKPLPQPFPWPPDALHILGLLQSGFGSRLEEFPNDVRMFAGRLILSAYNTGNRFDKRWALEAAGIVPEPILLWLLREGFASRSQWLREAAYRQAGRLGRVPEDIAREIRRALVQLLAEGRLRRERQATHAHVARLDRADHFLAVLRLLLWIPLIDFGLYVIALVILLLVLMYTDTFVTRAAILLAAYVFLSILSLRLRASLYCSSRLEVREFPGALGFLLLEVQIGAPFTLSTLLGTDAGLSFLCPLWTVLALQSARTGWFTTPVWWPLFPIVVAGRSILHLARNWKKALRTLSSILLGTAPMMALCAGSLYFCGTGRSAMAIIVAVLAMSFASDYRTGGYGRRVPSWLSSDSGLVLTYCVSFLVTLGLAQLFTEDTVMMLTALIIAGVLLAVLYISLLIALVWVEDRIRWHLWIRSRPASLTGSQLLKLLAKYQLLWGCMKFVKTVRERNLLAATVETESLLEKLCLRLEHDLVATGEGRERKTEGPAESDADSLDSLLIECAKKMEARSLISNEFLPRSEFLDEVYKLLRQARASREPQR